MHDERFSDEYPDDAQFYDGLEDHPGNPYPTIYEDAAFGGLGLGYLTRRSATPEPEPEPPARLLTPEEFMRKYGLGG